MLEGVNETYMRSMEGRKRVKRDGGGLFPHQLGVASQINCMMSSVTVPPELWTSSSSSLRVTNEEHMTAVSSFCSNLE